MFIILVIAIILFLLLAWIIKTVTQKNNKSFYNNSSTRFIRKDYKTSKELVKRIDNPRYGRPYKDAKKECEELTEVLVDDYFNDEN